MTTEQKIRRALVDGANSVPEASPDEIIVGLIEVLSASIVALKDPGRPLDSAVDLVCELLREDAKARFLQWNEPVAH